MFLSKRKQQGGLESMDPVSKESDGPKPLLECNLLAFENSLNDTTLFTDRVETWLDDCFGYGHTKLKIKQPKLNSWTNVLWNQSLHSKSSPSDTPCELQLHDWLWERESSASWISDFG
jgi:hypothetical protein